MEGPLSPPPSEEAVLSPFAHSFYSIVGTSHREDVTTDWPVSRTQGIRESSLFPCPWNVPNTHSGKHFQGCSLERARVVETTWTVDVTGPRYGFYINLEDSGWQIQRGAQFGAPKITLFMSSLAC